MERSTKGRYKPLRRNIAEKLCRHTHFSQAEIERLLSIFRNYAGVTKKEENGKIDRIKFHEVLNTNFGMTDDVLMDRVFRAFDLDSDSYLNEEEWVLGFSIFLKGTEEELVKYAFKVYDTNGDNYISREEMFQFLKESLVKQPQEEDPDEGIKDLVEILLKKMDNDHDSKISLQDFQECVKQEPLLSEPLGDCLPRRDYKQKFLDKLNQV